MRKTNKVIALVLGATMLSSLGACGDTGSGLKRDPKVLNISLFEGGYGLKFMESIADAFEAEHPGITVHIEPTRSFTDLQSQIQADRYVGDIMVNTTNWTSLGVKGYMADLTDVYQGYAYGEEGMSGAKTIEQKLGAVTDANEFEGKYYQMPVHSGITGLVYNKTYMDAMFGEGEYDLPVTSDELLEMFTAIKLAGGWPIIDEVGEGTGYGDFLRNNWFAQNLGYEEYKNYYELKYTNSQGEVVDAQTATEFLDAYEDDWLESYDPLCVMYANPAGNVPESARSMTFTQVQAYFVGYTAQKDAKPVKGVKGTAFMVNGDWLWGEIEKYEKVVDLDVRFMRTPVLSAIIEKCDSVQTEAQLRECVRYIDTVLDGTTGTRPTYLSNADYDRLLEARKTVWTTHAQQTAAIAKNCSDLDLAKEFLRFYASDVSAYSYAGNMNGLSSVFNSEITVESAQTEFVKSINQAFKDSLRVTYLQNAYSAYAGHSPVIIHRRASALFQGTSSPSLYSTHKGLWSAHWDDMMEIRNNK